MIEDQIGSYESLLVEIEKENDLIEKDIDQVRQNVLHETMMEENEEAVRARLNYIKKTLTDQIDDLKLELDENLLKGKIRAGRLSEWKNLKSHTGALKRDLNKIKKKEDSYNLDGLSEAVRNRKREVQRELRELKKKLRKLNV